VRVEGPRQLPDKLKTCRHVDPKEGEPGSAEARRALEFRPQTVAAASAQMAKFPAQETSAGPADGGRRTAKGPRQLPDKLKTCRHGGRDERMTELLVALGPNWPKSTGLLRIHTFYGL